MPAPDPNNVLFKIAHPDLYEHNPFNVLNLPVDATARDIRRRKEDVEAAFDAGTEAAEFANILPGDETRKTPTRAEVDDLFATLEDPEKRIAYALFWFWPDDMNDIERETNRKRNRNPNGSFGHRETVSVWDKDARMPDDATTTVWISRHNLAVFSHMMGLVYELELKAIPQASASTPDYVNDYWRSSISWWNAIVGEPEFWRYAIDLVSSLADPRVDHRFVRSLRDQFAFAFDQINVELAIDFAKTGRDADAKRQVEYMKISQPDSDDVEGTFDDAFAGLLRQTEAIVKTARDEAQKNPKVGLKKANEILSQTAEPLRISRIVFEKGAPIRDSIVTTIFAGVRSCLIDYGNDTKGWESCVKLGKQLLSIAETSSQISLVNRDLQTLADNIEANSEVCGCCKQKFRANESSHSISVPLVGNLKKGENGQSVRYSAREMRIPICSSCLKRFAATNNLSYKSIPETIIHPFVMDALKHGWRVGNELSQAAVSEFLLEERDRERQEWLNATPCVFTSIDKDGRVKTVEKRGGISELNEADRRLIKEFHSWCQKLETVFPLLTALSAKDQIALANLFLSALNKTAEKPGDNFATLETLRQLDSDSVEGKDMGVHLRRTPPRPLAQAYRDGYSFLSRIHYNEAIYLDPVRAEKSIGRALQNSSTLTGRVIVNSREPVRFHGGEMYGGGWFTSVEVYLSKSRLFHLQKNTGYYSLRFVFENLNPEKWRPGSVLPFFQLSISQTVSGNQNDTTPIQIGERCREKLHRLYNRGELSANFISTHFKNEDEIVQFSLTVVKRLTDIILAEIETAGWCHSIDQPKELELTKSWHVQSDGKTLDLL